MRAGKREKESSSEKTQSTLDNIFIVKVINWYRYMQPVWNFHWIYLVRGAALCFNATSYFACCLLFHSTDHADAAAAAFDLAVEPDT